MELEGKYLPEMAAYANRSTLHIERALGMGIGIGTLDLDETMVFFSFPS
jgi:hypothetical protein